MKHLGKFALAALLASSIAIPAHAAGNGGSSGGSAGGSASASGSAGASVGGNSVSVTGNGGNTAHATAGTAGTTTNGNVSGTSTTGGIVGTNTTANGVAVGGTGAHVIHPTTGKFGANTDRAPAFGANADRNTVATPADPTVGHGTVDVNRGNTTIVPRATRGAIDTNTTVGANITGNARGAGQAFTSNDADHSGGLSMTEYQKLNGAGGSHAAVQKDFSKLDTNNDNQVSEQELNAGYVGADANTTSR